MIPQIESLEKPFWEDVFVRLPGRFEAAAAQKTTSPGNGAFMKRIVPFFSAKALFVHDGRH